MSDVPADGRSPGPADATELTLRARLVAATVAAGVAAVVTNPLDVLKTQIQANHALLGSHARDYACPTACATTGVSSVKCAPACELPTRVGDVARRIVREHGARGFWRGTGGALASAFPTVGIYLPCYDYAVEALVRDGMDRDIAPAVAGGGARTLAVMATAPLELARTRVLATKRGSGGVLGESGGRAFVGALRESARGTSGRFSGARGIRPVQRGVLVRRRAVSNVSHEQAAAINFVSGCAAGTVVAAATTPLDVVKTRVQIRDIAPTNFASSTETAPGISNRGIVGELVSVARMGGIQALYAGWGARAARAAPTGAIVLVAYELVKRLN
ncbi:putative mitochondrial carrier protein [Ostreococcus tauri]|uniref:Putative mitochondrial carrier protein n=1 Tax=Ostreococcus tauri TaxID=70448 RepID=A0A1Y5I8S6_OSTTA|nr:putative mitochondrial carrier protein [Ostreococcus tauri]